MVRDSMTYEQNLSKWIDYSYRQRDTILQYKRRDILLSAQHDRTDEARRNRRPTVSVDTAYLRAAIIKELGLVQH